MAATGGSPDWQGAAAAGDFTVLPGFGDGRIAFALPTRARLARRADGGPAFSLEFVSSRNGAAVADSLYAFISLGLERDGDLSPARAALAAAGAQDSASAPAVMPASFAPDGRCHLECAGARVTVPFAWEDAQRATLRGRLDTGAATLLYGALAGGSAPVAQAAVECAFGAVLPRIDAAAAFDAAELVAALAALGTPGPGGAAPFARIVHFFETGGQGLVRLDGADRGGAGRSLGLALAGRVVQAFGRPAPPAGVALGPWVALDAPPGGAVRWDLRTPVFAEIPVFLAYDPFTPIVAAGERAAVTGFTAVPQLPNALRTRRVTVAAALPPGLRGCDAVDLTLRVDRARSATGDALLRRVNIHPGPPPAAPVDLEFASLAGPKPVTARLTLVGMDGGEPLRTPWFDVEDDYLVVDGGRLPGASVTVVATPELLAQAEVAVSLGGAFGVPGGGPAPSATLTAAAPAASFLLPAPDDGARMGVTARSLVAPAAARALDLPCRSATLDLGSFPDYGPQATRVALRFAGGLDGAVIEFRDEGPGGRVTALPFSAERPGQFFRCPSDSVFGTRFRVRPRAAPGRPPADWSEARSAGADLSIEARPGPDGPALTLLPPDPSPGPSPDPSPDPSPEGEHTR